MARAVLFDRQPLDRIVRWRTVANVLSTGFEVRRYFQCSAGKSYAIFGQAFDRLLIFDGVDFDERVECDESILLGIGHPDLLQCALGPRVLALRQLVQNIGGLVHPTALTAGLWPNLLERLPEPECTVGNRELGTSVIICNMAVDLFWTVTPCACTAGGSWASAFDARFCTSTCTVS